MSPPPCPFPTLTPQNSFAVFPKLWPVSQVVTLHKETIKKLPKSQNVFFGGSRTKTEIDGYTAKEMQHWEKN